jgi:hypothetical protein
VADRRDDGQSLRAWPKLLALDGDLVPQQAAFARSPARPGPCRPVPARWNIGPVITGPMFHRAGWLRVTLAPRAAAAPAVP